VSQWQLTRAFTSFCALHNFPLANHNFNSSTVTAQYQCSIPAVKTAVCCFQTLAPLNVLFLFISPGMSELSGTVLMIKLTCSSNDRVQLFCFWSTWSRIQWPYFFQTRYIMASGLSETLVESCMLVGVFWWGYISYFLCLLFYNMWLQLKTLMERECRKAFLSISDFLTLAYSWKSKL